MGFERVEIGDAMLYHGDCRDVLPTLEAVDLIFTDPPYGHNNNDGDLIHRWEAALGRGKSGAARPIANDGAEDVETLIPWLFAEAAKLLRNGGCCCCCGGGGPDPQFARWSLWMDDPLDFKQMVIWDKGPMGMGWHYRRSYETILVGQKRGGACKWHDDTDRVENIIRPGQYGIRKIIPDADEHPTPKPPALAAHFVRLHSVPGDTVLDPFMGAGSTGIAALTMGRKFIGVELDRRWFDLSCRRIDAAQKQGRLPIDVAPPKPEQQSINLNLETPP